MASPEENMQAALDRAEKFRKEGNLERAAVWEASADRYKRIIDIKERLDKSKQNVEAIKERISKINENNNIGVGTPIATPSDTATRTVKKTYTENNDFENNTYIPTVQIKPIPPIPIPPPPPPPPPVKTAPIDTVLFNDESIPVEIMTDLIFEDIGGQELINIVRSDLIDGQKLDYVPIKNITNIQQQYNPNNILALQNTSDKFFSNFNISLDDKIPTVLTSSGLLPGDPFIYIEEETGNLIIELANLASDNEVQVSFMSNGTIYELEINES